MAITVNGIVCQELVAEQMEQFDILQGPSQIKGLVCDWGSRFAVAQGLLGLNSSTSIGGLITLKTPFQYPELATSYATSVSIKGVGLPFQGSNQLAFVKALLIVNFSCLPWSFAGLSANDFNNQIDPAHPYVYAEQNTSFTSEWITVPGKSVFYKSSGKPLDADWGFRMPIVNFTIDIKYVPYIPAPSIIVATAAPVSSTVYLGCPAGQLLFNGAENHQVRMSDGSLTQSVAYSFSYRPIAPWDYVYNGAIPGWDQVVDSSGTAIQKRSDLSSIIPSFYDL